MANPLDVFVSFGRRDSELAERIVRELRRLAIEPTRAEDAVSGGEDWRQSIMSAIRRSDAFLLVVGSPDTVSGCWASYELGMAETLGKRVVLLLSHNYSSAQLPPDLTGIPIVPFDPAQPEAAAREVVERLLAAA